MGMRLTVTVGPFARCAYTGRRPDVAELTDERLWDIDNEDPVKGWLHVASNRSVDETLRFDCSAVPTPIDEMKRAEHVASFITEHAKDLAAIEAATGNAPQVLWGVMAWYS